MSAVTFADTEAVVKRWLATTSVAPLISRPGGGLNIFGAMPNSSPLPALIVTRVGGGVDAVAEVPSDLARISFACWAATKDSASALYRAVLGEVDTLARVGGWTEAPTTLLAGSVESVVWLPDPDSDVPRYIVDAHMITITTT